MINDNEKEIFDIVDEKDRVVGQATRVQVHGNPKLIHRSIGVVIFNKKGEIFFQKRSFTKDVDPGKWTISCSGHVIKSSSAPEGLKIKSFCHPDHASAGKDKRYSDSSTVGGIPSGYPRGVLRHIYEEAAHRELKEELGIAVDNGICKGTPCRPCPCRPCRPARGPLKLTLKLKPVGKFLFRGKTETEMVMLFKAFYDGPFELNKQEISQGKFFTRNKLNSLIKSGKIKFSPEGKMALRKIGVLD